MTHFLACSASANVQFSGRFSAFFAKRRARRLELESIRSLRQYDRHLLSDINLDREALWRPEPHIAVVQSPV